MRPSDADSRRPGAAPPSEAQPAGRAAPLLAAAFAAVILTHFHDRFWWPPDEGVYAYVAQRLLAGDRLHVDVQDLHAGYVNLLHAGAFRLFGEDLVSLRYPLAALGVLQAAIIAALFRRAGPMLATVAGIAFTCLGFVQFLNPSANWYALAVAVATVALLAWWPPERARSRAVALGALLSLAFLSRQLTGVLIAMGALAFLLLERPPQAPRGGRPDLLGRGLFGLMALGLAAYLWRSSDAFGALLFGAAPLLLLLLGIARGTGETAGGILRLLLAMGGGAACAAAPLVGFHLWEGNLLPWLRDLLITPFGILAQDFLAQARFLHLGIRALMTLATPPDALAVASAIFWILLLFSPPLLGLVVLRGLARGTAVPALHPLPVVALFHGIVALHYQIPIYLLFTAGLTAVGLAFVLGSRPRGAWPMVALLGFLSLVALATQAAQPISRGIGGIVAGQRVPLEAREGLPGARLAMEEADRAVYAGLLEVIAATAGPDEPIFALPMNPEFYFLSRRRPPVAFFATALGLRSEADIDAARARLAATPPRLTIHRREDKYNNAETLALLAWIAARSEPPRRLGPFDLYLWRGEGR